MERIFFEITIIICLAAFLSIVFRFLKQPSILAYILTGVLLGPLGLFHLQNHEALQTFGQLGITLLLFMLGLEIKLGEVRTLGKPVLVIGLLQIWFTFVIGFFVSELLGLNAVQSIFISIGLTFSSTIVIVKILSDKKDLTSLHGKIAVGILLLQDFFAVLVLVFLSQGTNDVHLPLFLQVLIILIKVAALFGIVLFLSKSFFPKITPYVARSQESFFLFSLAWVFAFTAFVASPFIGFSVEIGGFLAGLAFANTHENYHIISKMKSLRDFFITIFFVMLGLEMTFTHVVQALLPALILSAFVLLVKPLLVMVLTGLYGYKKRTSFFVGVSLSQVSEFSLIILFLGVQNHVITPEIVTIMILVCMITFAFSTYMLQNWNQLYKKLEQYLRFLEGEHTKKDITLHNQKEENLTGHVIVIGGDQMGQSIYHSLKDEGENVLIIDFNPEIVEKLMKKNIPVLFGDISDMEIQEASHLHDAELVISTVPDIEDNLLLIEALNHTNRRAKIVVMSYETDEAKLLYKKGADYVVLPHLAGGRHLAKILVDKNHLKLIEDYKKKDLSSLI